MPQPQPSPWQRHTPTCKEHSHHFKDLASLVSIIHDDLLGMTVGAHTTLSRWQVADYKQMCTSVLCLPPRPLQLPDQLASAEGAPWLFSPMQGTMPSAGMWT